MVRGFVPQLHVASVARSLEFYLGFGFECSSRFGPEGAPYWARLAGDTVDLMLVAADGPIDPTVQGVLFYLYTSDLGSVRDKLLDRGLVDGGEYSGAFEGDTPESGILFAPTHPFYMPEGLMRVHDPDGYVLLIGQNS